MTELVIATRSTHKLREIRQILASLGALHVRSLADMEVPESSDEEEIERFDTFEENALAKARYFANLTGLTVLADDSGICVDALDGAPGVRSKRWSGRGDLTGAELDRANNETLLARLDDVPPEGRTARFRCAVAMAVPDGPEVVVDGTLEGAVLEVPRGAGGFGYDPLFLVTELGRTLAEVPEAVKNEISHRARAIRAAGDVLAAGWPFPEEPRAGR